MKKFIHVVYVIIMRIFIFLMALALSPMWVFFGMFVAVMALFGEADDLFDPDYYDEVKNNERRTIERESREREGIAEQNIELTKKIYKSEDNTENTIDN